MHGYEILYKGTQVWIGGIKAIIHTKVSMENYGSINKEAN